MIRREKITALVASRRDIGEADRLITLFSETYGLLQVVAKGVRKIPSRRGGHGEPLTAILAVISGRPGRYYMAAAETTDYFSKLHADVDALQRAQYMMWVLKGLFEEEDAQPTLFAILHDAWRLLPQLTEAKRGVLEVTVMLSLLHAGGVMPQLKACQHCRRGTPQEAVILDPHKGGWVCISCSPTLSGAADSITARGLKVLRFVAVRPSEALRLRISADESNQLAAAVRSYAASFVHRPVRAQ